jgi:hypothetical protein
VVAKEAVIVVFICDVHATGCTHPQLRSARTDDNNVNDSHININNNNNIGLLFII